MSISSRVFRARYVFPGCGPPLEGGVVTVAGGRVVGVARESDGPAPVDLGDVAILPGLVNAHVHLEFSDLTAPLGRPGMRFPEWIRCVIEHRMTVQADPVAAATAGLAESLRHGTTTLGEIATGRWNSDPVDLSPIDCTVFYELIALASEQIEERCEAARQHLALDSRRATSVDMTRDKSGEQHPSWRAGISPHAPYTVHPELLSRLIQLACETGAPLAMHLAESPEELELLADGSGLFAELLAARGNWNPETIPRGTRPLDYLRRLAKAPRSLVIHGNYLNAEGISFVGQHAERMAVVYCPRTHAYFEHPTHPLVQLLECGATVALGTDGRSSNPDLSLLEEMRMVAQRFPSILPADVLRLGTINGARALGCDDRCGSLEVGKQADLMIVPVGLRRCDDPHELVFDSEASAVGTMIGGELVYCSYNFAEVIE